MIVAIKENLLNLCPFTANIELSPVITVFFKGMAAEKSTQNDRNNRPVNIFNTPKQKSVAVNPYDLVSQYSVAITDSAAKEL